MTFVTPLRLPAPLRLKVTAMSVGSAALLLSLTTAGAPPAKPVVSAPAAAIASGKTFWVDSQPDPADAIINARVDIGTLRQQGGEIEAKLAWPMTSGSLRDARASHPGVSIPEGSASIETERVTCRENSAFSYEVANEIVAPGGKVVAKDTFNPADEKAKAQKYDEMLSSATASYGPDPRSLVCWAAARKCEGKDYIWPPPPNETPLEYSDRATQMRAAYNGPFVPKCRL